MLSSGSVKKMLKKGQAIVDHLFMMNMMTNSEEELIDDGLQNVLVKYANIFAEPKSLPPARLFDHATS